MKHVLTLAFCALVFIALSGCLALPQSSVPTDSYIACGCGCCVFREPLENIASTECIYRSQGGNLQEIIEADRELVNSQECYSLGCSFPVKYVYCD